jgi:glyoxylase-like metal-dependent hydrolase (beta-lactamase superfamily II)
MLRLERYDDVVRLHMSTARSRLVGYSVSAYLTRGALIDTGFPAVATALAAFLEHHRPAGVVLTHHHEDHAGNLELIATRGVAVAAPAQTVAMARAGDPHAFYRLFTWGAMPRLVSALSPFEPAGLTLVHTPGHSRDHHVVWDAERETLFSGDLFLGVKVRVARPEEDPRVHVESLRTAAALRPKRLFDGHRGPVDAPVAALTAKADWMEHTIDRIDRRLDAGWSDRRAARDVMGREDLTYYFSAGDLSRVNFVRAVRRTRSRDADRATAGPAAS